MGSCRVKKMLRNVELESWSGNGSRNVCNVNGRTDAKHVVRITSYKTFPVRVDCTGAIDSNPLMTRFDCPSNTSVTPTRWQATNVVPPKIGRQRPNSCEFRHVSLLTGDVSGDDNVRTEVSLSWPKGQTDSISLGFSIST